MILIDLEPDVTAFITTTIIKTKLPTVRKYRILNRKNITMSKQQYSNINIQEMITR